MEKVEYISMTQQIMVSIFMDYMVSIIKILVKHVINSTYKTVVDLKWTIENNIAKFQIFINS